MSNNPYSHPMGAPSQFQQNPIGKLKAPAICLIVVTSISILAVGISTLARIITGEFGGMDGAEAMGRLAGSVGATFGMVAFQVAILIGAINMLQGKSRSTCMLAAILACVPICSPCIILGIPFGIWSLVVLSNPDVAKAFKS